MISTEKEFRTYLQGKENIYLYGAGKMADRYLYYCKKSGIKVDGLLVSGREGNPCEKGGLPVLALDELEAAGLEASGLHVIVTMAGGIRKWLDVFCGPPRFGSLLFISDRLQRELSRREMKYRFDEAQDRYRLEVDWPKMENEQGLLIERESGLAIARMPLHARLQMVRPLLDLGTREAFEEQFGPLRILPVALGERTGQHPTEQGKVEIYVATSHMDRAQAADIGRGVYVPIQVGAALTDIRKGCITDDTGENISYRNRDYCECTGLYWIWKNTSGQDYVGLNHYRRRLMLDEDSIRYLKEQDLDLVAAHPQFEKETIEEFFEQYICRQDWQLLEQAVRRQGREYASCLERYKRGHFYFPCNVALWKREWFDRYCRFAFDAASEIDAFYQERGIIREDRYMGYLFEQLSTVFIMRYYSDMKAACTQIEWID